MGEGHAAGSAPVGGVAHQGHVGNPASLRHQPEQVPMRPFDRSVDVAVATGKFVRWTMRGNGEIAGHDRVS